MDNDELFPVKHFRLQTYTRSKKDGEKIASNNQTKSKCLIQRKKKSCVFSLSDDSQDSKISPKSRKKKSSCQSVKRRQKNSIAQQDDNETNKPLKTISNGKDSVTKLLTCSTALKSVSARKRKSHLLQHTAANNNLHIKYSPDKKKTWKSQRKDSSDSSIEILRKDVDVSWQDKISLLMPKMGFHQNQDTSGTLKNKHFGGLNLSFEEVDDNEEDLSYTWVTESQTNSENNSKTSGRQFNNSSSQYTFVTTLQMTSGQTSKTLTKHKDSQSSASRCMLLTKSETNKENLLSPSSLRKVPVHRASQNLPCIDDSESVIMKEAESNIYFNSTIKKDALDIMHVDFPTDISAIEHANDMQRKAESTPKTSKTNFQTVAPCKSKRKQNHQGRFLPKNSTKLFISEYVEMENMMSELSSIACIPNKKDGCLSVPISKKKVNHVQEKRSETSVEHKFQSTSKVTEKISRNKILTSTPTSFGQKPVAFKNDLTAVQRQISDGELDVEESRIVNSEEIVPVYSEEENMPFEGRIFPEAKLSRNREHPTLDRSYQRDNPSAVIGEKKNESKKIAGMKKKQSLRIESTVSGSSHTKNTDKLSGIGASQTEPKLVIFPPVTHNIKNVPICCLIDPKIIFPPKRCIVLKKTVPSHMRVDENEIIEDAITKYHELTLTQRKAYECS